MKATSESEMVSSNRELCVFDIRRTLGGIAIGLQSEILEDCFKAISGGKVEIAGSGWGKGNEYYVVDKFTLPGSEYVNRIILMGYSSSELIIPGSSLDFSFIKTVGVKNGITVECKGLFLQEEVDSLKQDFKRFITAFYHGYIKAESFQLRITSVE